MDIQSICPQKEFLLLFLSFFSSITFLYQCMILVKDVLAGFVNLIFKEPIRVTGNSLNDCMAEVSVKM